MAPRGTVHADPEAFLDYPEAPISPVASLCGPSLPYPVREAGWPIPS